jgi:hypothetical protein
MDSDLGLAGYVWAASPSKGCYAPDHVNKTGKSPRRTAVGWSRAATFSYHRRLTVARTRRPATTIAAPSGRRALRPPAPGKRGPKDPPAGTAGRGVDVAGAAVGAGDGFFCGSGGGGGCGVRVGTVCRAGLCSAAAHISGPVANPTITIPRTTTQSTILFIESTTIRLGYSTTSARRVQQNRQGVSQFDAA